MFPYLSICLFFFFFLWTFFHVLKLGPGKWGSGQLPPGPRPYPIIGNILELGARPHESLANLAKTYGPLMSLKLGSVTTIIVSSSSAAKEVLHKNDRSFAHRTVLDAIRALDHHKRSVIWSDADSKWRNLRKVCNTEIFSVQKLDACQDLRQKKIQELLYYVNHCCHTGQPVQIGRAAFTTTLNLLSNSIFSSDLASHTSESSQEFKDVVWGIMEVAGKPNLADFFPAIRWIDPLGVRRGMAVHFGRLIEIFDGVIKRRIELGDTGGRKSDALDALIQLTKQQGSDFRCIDISHLFAGSDKKMHLPLCESDLHHF
ncbi:Cytochrome P450 [Dillenia turbinata]|uniref:Cytochrome P450 n=1 Tax=Dillenia turbinata TaxID=194707 RepID=A0AAN8V3E4_9MAGN